MRRTILLVCVTLFAAACGDGGGSTTLPPGPPATVPAGQTTTTLDPRPCPGTTVIAPEGGDGAAPAVERLPSGNPYAAAVAASQSMFDCATDVIVVGTASIDLVAMAATLAVALQAPLLFGDEGMTSLLAYELDRLAPQRLWLIGDSVAEAPEWTQVTRIEGDDATIAAEVARLSGADEKMFLPTEGGTATVAVAVEAMVTGKYLTPHATDGTTQAAPTTTGDDVVAGTGESGMLWLVDVEEPEAALVAAAGAITSGGFMGLVNGDDLRGDTAVSRDLMPIADRVRAIQIVGANPDAGWQAQVLLRGDQLPGGGFLMFPGRRLIALYGNPATTSLGVLGEQGPEAGLDRIDSLSVGFDADGMQILPTFEIIATVAAGNPGNDGDYSNEVPVDLLRTWIDVAAAEGAYVLLDLQPGRARFIDQAVLYEELLLYPHVGLALDPEWKLGPDQLPLQQIGGVGAEEVNEVVDWLADLVRENALPQKVLLLHQFRDDMLRDRNLIHHPKELALVIQMDGFGTYPEKLTTWNRTTKGWEDGEFLFGWKSFFDEDVPGPMAPDVILELEPSVVYVSFQ